MAHITDKAFQAYTLFIRSHCPSKGNEKVLCKECPKYKGKCTHSSHPEFKLFSK
jgi:hypothetical protein